MKLSFLHRVIFLAALSMFNAASHAQTLGPDFSAAYKITSLGAAPGVPSQFGGLTFKSDDADSLLLAGLATTEFGAIYNVGLERDTNKHVVSFTGVTSLFANAPGTRLGTGIDGGLAYGPSNVLFYTSFDDNTIGQIKPGQTNPAVQIPLTPLGVGTLPAGSSVGSLTFVPEGFPGQGHLKILCFGNDTWYDATVSPDTNGTFQIALSGKTVDLPNTGPEGVIYIAGGNPGFENDSVLISEYSSQKVIAYEIDGNGDPIFSTGRIFIDDLIGIEGAAIDPITGDFLFSTFGGGDQVIAVQGFTVNPLNKRPVVKITSPANNSTAAPGSSITLNITATDADGTIASVEIFESGTSLVVLSNAPYTFVVTNLELGQNIFTARAVDNQNGRSISEPVIVNVSSPTGPASLSGTAEPDKTFSVTLRTEPNGNYQLQASTNLTSWNTITNVTSGQNTSVKVNDPDATKFRYRFYRTVTQ